MPLRTERLKWLTGFSGSAGVAIVLTDRAVFVWPPLQVRDQVDLGIFNQSDRQPATAGSGRIGRGAVKPVAAHHLESGPDRLGQNRRDAGTAVGKPNRLLWDDQPKPRSSSRSPIAYAATGQGQLAGWQRPSPGRCDQRAHRSVLHRLGVQSRRQRAAHAARINSIALRQAILLFMTSANCTPQSLSDAACRLRRPRWRRSGMARSGDHRSTLLAPASKVLVRKWRQDRPAPIRPPAHATRTRPDIRLALPTGGGAAVCNCAGSTSGQSARSTDFRGHRLEETRRVTGAKPDAAARRLLRDHSGRRLQQRDHALPHLARPTAA